MRTFLLIFLCSFCCAFSASAYSTNFSNEASGPKIEKLLLIHGITLEELDSSNYQGKENPRLVSILLGIALGPFGGHRLYLGTKPHVPVVYTLTLGGGFGILPLIDLFHLVFSKDLEPFRNNGNVFMWRPDNATPP